MQQSKASPLLFLNRPLVRGVGIYQKGHYASWKDGKISAEYAIWLNMLTKCYAKPDSGFTASEEFKDFQAFAAWCNSQLGFKLEKPYFDISLLGNKTNCYNRDLCVFLPVSISRHLANGPKKSSGFPLGVSTTKKSPNLFLAHIKVNMGKHVYLGSFKDVEEAAKVYREAKEDYIKQLAEDFKDVLDERAYSALMNFKIT